MPRVVHFEISADDPTRVGEFYASVFGWKIRKWDGPMEYWLVETGTDAPGIDGAIMPRVGGGAARTMNTIDVPDLERYVERIEAAGGRRVSPTVPVPGVGWFAYCEDPEGTTFGVMQTDPTAGT